MTLLEEGLRALYAAATGQAAAALESRFETLVERSRRYLDEITLFNGAYGLVSRAGADELVVKHLLDSLAGGLVIAERLPSESAAIADIGSGAGLPGIPLAIAFPRCQITLVERSGRRAGFLRNAAAVLGLENCAILHTDFAELAASRKTPPTAGEAAREATRNAERFAALTFRAFQPLSAKLYDALVPLCAPFGVIAAYKGRAETLNFEMAALTAVRPSLHWEAVPCPVPFLPEERHIVLIHPE